MICYNTSTTGWVESPKQNTLDIQSYPPEVWCLIGMFWGSNRRCDWISKGTANNQALRIQTPSREFVGLIVVLNAILKS